MAKLFNMDLYRMVKAKSFRILLALTFAIFLGSMPMLKGLYDLAKMLSPEGMTETFEATRTLSSLISSPFSIITLMLILLSVVFFFYADMENGYIKNIAGQMPKRGFSILSRYLAAIVHNAVFMVAAVAGNVIGAMLVVKVTIDSAIVTGIGAFLLELLLLQSICAILLLVTASLRSKSFGIVLAVLFGVGATFLLYSALDSGLDMLIKGFKIAPYMPDTLLNNPFDANGNLMVLRSVLSAAVTTGIFLPLSIGVFDKRDVK